MRLEIENAAALENHGVEELDGHSLRAVLLVLDRSRIVEPASGVTENVVGLAGTETEHQRSLLGSGEEHENTTPVLIPPVGPFAALSLGDRELGAPTSLGPTEDVEELGFLSVISSRPVKVAVILDFPAIYSKP